MVINKLVSEIVGDLNADNKEEKVMEIKALVRELFSNQTKIKKLTESNLKIKEKLKEMDMPETLSLDL